MQGTKQARQCLLDTFGVTIQTPAGAIRGIFRDALTDTHLRRRGQSGVGVALSVNQPTLFVDHSVAQSLSEGDILTVQDKPWLVGRRPFQTNSVGLMQIPLLESTAPGQWR
jgi:hypothetical protein